MSTHTIAVRDYDLAATLTSGQAFRWQRSGDAWEGVVAGRWVRLRDASATGDSNPANGAPISRSALPRTTSDTGRPGDRRSFSDSDGHCLQAETAVETRDWSWLESYLNTGEELATVLRCFPDDEPLRAAVASCRGLRLLQQEPWECLASFILSSTKQIVQIQQVVRTMCERHGTAIAVPAGHPTACAFPTAQRLAGVTEAELRDCRMGFRARHLHEAARAVASGELDLESLRQLPLDQARERLMQLPGVGRKIADCTLLFSLGFRRAFPVDVWIADALRAFYFRGRRMPPRRVLEFIGTYFGPEAGYAQQYLFHYARLHPERLKARPRSTTARTRHDTH